VWATRTETEEHFPTFAPVTAQRAAHPCGKVATNLFLSGKNNRLARVGQWGSHAVRSAGSDFSIQEN
jgi:hypothetical protein